MPGGEKMNTSFVLLIARILLSIIFIGAGVAKLGAIAGTAGFMASKGIPMSGILVYGVIGGEILGGLAILFGFMTKWASWGLAAFCVVSGLIFHFEPDNQEQMTTFLRNLAIAGGFLALSVSGAGSISIDARRK